MAEDNDVDPTSAEVFETAHGHVDAFGRAWIVVHHTDGFEILGVFLHIERER
jgi:hypothetical protein